MASVTTPSPEETHALDAFERFFHLWWVIALLALLGGGAGYLVRVLQPVTYEAQTLMLVSINFNKIDFIHPPAPTPAPYVISQADEDNFLNVVFDSYNRVVPQVVEYARQDGYQVTRAGLIKQSHVERKHTYWVLHYRNADPAMAQKLANYWTQLAYANLVSRHAAGEINPGLFFRFVQPASLPTTPFRDRVNVFVLFGTAVGLVTGCLLVSRFTIKYGQPVSLRGGQQPFPPSRHSHEFVFRDKISRLWHYGWVVALLTAAGLLGGWLVHQAKPPVYEAQAGLSAKIDYKKLLYMIPPSYDPLPNQVTFYDEDLSLVILDASLRSVVTQVAEYAHQNGVPLDEAALLNLVTIERMETSYHVNFRYADPAVAQDIANTWAQLGVADLQAEQAAGKFPDYISVQLVQQAGLPQKPTYFQPVQMVVAGGVIGLIAGLLFVNLPWFKMDRRR